MAHDYTPKEKLFIKYYVKERNAKKAAELAGYSVDSAKEIGYENLTKPHIKEAVDKALKKLEEKAEIDTLMIIRELKKIGFANIKDMLTWDSTGMRVKTTEEMHDDAAAAISSIEATSTTVVSNYYKEDGDETREEKKEKDFKIKLRTHSKTHALELLGKYLRMFVERTEISGANGGPIKLDITGLSDEELERRNKEMLDRLNKKYKK